MTTATEQHVDPLTAMLYPAYTKRCDHCGGFVVASPQEAMQAAMEPLATLARALQDPAAYMTGLPTMGAAATAPAPAPAFPGLGAYQHPHHHEHRHHGHHGDCGCDDCRGRHHGHHHHHDCHCRECGRDDCHCRCCVVDADLVVNARLGERRVVPITIENRRRREREVRLELSEFTSRGGSQSVVQGMLAPPTEFTLAPCSEHQAIVEIDYTPDRQRPVPKPAPKDRKAAASSEEGGDDNQTERRIPDVDDCVVAYADLRIVGCDHRPVRIAVATLPRDCHAYPVECACGCC